MLKDIDLSQRIVPDKKYKKAMKRLQIKLLGMQRALVDHSIGCIFVFEGWDAAGKGGAIKRLTEGLDPRGYEVHPVSAPTAEEKARHYLQRFMVNMPKYGEIGIFDRSWYGRVLVERVEQFAKEKEWAMAYEEINHFEQLYSSHSFIIMKFWLHISKEEQLRRFESRQNNPLKSWKITDEDWRNREKWDDYERAADDMISKTDTLMAPWHVIEGEDKDFARMKVLQLVADRLEEECIKRDIPLNQYYKIDMD
ncbi:UDP-galactose-lipid carrier transferase [Bacillus lacus]|uniref:UDP-galactose-lipid carrier transferase n=1 Tax=Metabacillus lacus TaxID=1983721 RepID=A0A7X2J353_9BACI|nr:UDP-galactose-lipid carrier transferase [Metabacillus lacus]MRX73738.1 UDP-galactose-lipid carrier transferase [Metabacillus lacus]